MQFQELEQHLSQKKELHTAHYSAGLRLRPNYLLYTWESPLSLEQKSFLEEKEIPWAEYTNASPLQALVAFLKSVEGGIYIPKVEDELLSLASTQSVFLLDPHLIEDFEKSLSKKRRGVLIRRSILASFNFEKAINLKDL